MVKLIRLEKSTDGVLGVLIIDNEIFCCTLEPEDKNNQVGVSCIPTGYYECLRYSSEKYPETFEVTDVPNRSKILFHKGCTEIDSRGCILLGETFGKLKGKRAVLNSGATFKRFLEKFQNTKSFDLVITDI